MKDFKKAALIGVTTLVTACGGTMQGVVRGKALPSNFSTNKG
ncbi:hypothetical protein SAMN04488527_15611 [Aliiroseovarius crassostreae]|nr:hypothetical protein SAMN04488527_15611 [Aliiroseovarius crassostreae]